MADVFSESALTQDDLAALGEAILAAYPDKEALYALLLAKWGVRVGDVVFTGEARALVIAALIDWARAQGRALDLLSVTWAHKHAEQLLLHQLAERFFPLAARGSGKDGVDATLSSVGGLAATGIDSSMSKSFFGKGRVAGVAFDADRLSKLSGALCVVEVGKTAKATGFLIGRRTVLTVHHVVRDAIVGKWPGERIRLSFDRRSGMEEKLVAAAPGPAWLGPFSPASPADLSRDGEPEPDQLDFAVIRLAAPVAAGRAVLALPEAVPIVAPGDDMIILQHAMGGPLVIGTGRLLGYSLGGERLHYVANTAPGSAGSPVLDGGGRLIAMHHAAHDIEGRRIAQGVPIWPIRRAIGAAGLGDADA